MRPIRAIPSILCAVIYCAFSVILNGAERSEESLCWAKWRARFFALLRMTTLPHTTKKSVIRARGQYSDAPSDQTGGTPAQTSEDR